MILTLGVPVTQRRCTHVTQPDGPLAAAVYKGVAVVGVELSCCDHLRELLHVGWLDVHDIWHRRVKEGPGDGGRTWGISSYGALGALELRSETGMVAHDSNYATQEAEAGGLLEVQVQPGHAVKPCLKELTLSGSSS